MTTAPVAEPDRLISMDVLRGFVLLGIFVMNIQSFSMPGAAYMNPTAYGDLTGANLWVWLLSHLFFDQKFMTVFSMLFGAGIVLMIARAGADGPRLHRRRMGWLILFGLLHAYLLWYGDILYSYGVCGLIAYLFRNKSPRWLLVTGAVLIMVGLGAVLLLGWIIPPEAMPEIRDTDWKPTADVIARELAAYRGGFLDQASHRTGESLSFELFYFFIFVIWRVVGLMMIGMAFLRLEIFTATRPASFYARFAAINLAIGFPIVAFGIWRNFAHGWTVEYSMFPGQSYNYIGSVFVSLGYTGMIMWIVRTGALRSLCARFAAVGRMAFSNYIFHTLVATTIFYGHGFGLFGYVERTGQIAIVLPVWAFQLIVSPIWLRHFQFGPLEWIWRSLTYGRKQPMRRIAGGFAAA